MSRLGQHRQRAARSPACQAKARLQSLDDTRRKSADPAQRRALRQERAWLAVNTLTTNRR